ncbi:bifunctional 3-phenylpropionate/cinnamic acid dioxygenase ferredoxin subunit [Longispora sp. K20-0274]|uniref:bifunctional 3-phenylpropionate/cinnamic acid dioxygenase ferredoxin subunit n=1 Tax=Longispora sp. K20-0274 TaxID=3088255 RepID=UPI00399C199F
MGEAVRVCGVEEVREGRSLWVSAADAGWSEPVAVFCEGGEFFALDDTCTHEEASLSEGFVEDGCVECPLHASRFSLRTGEVVADPATRPVRAHLVEVRDGQVWLSAGAPPSPASG